jgi:hypothetical protein
MITRMRLIITLYMFCLFQNSTYYTQYAKTKRPIDKK